MLDEWGFGYDDAQQFVIASALREQPDGRWSAKEVGVEEPRQNGKGEIIEGREALGLFYLGERKLIHSAHEFATASEALDRMDDRIGRNPSLKRLVKSVKRSHGEEGVYLKDGRKLLYKTRTKGSGRGFSADLLTLDEAMFVAEAFLGALMPVISARPNPQIWYLGSAVDQQLMEHGVVFARARERALSGDSGRLAYFGWSPAYSRGWRTPDDVSREDARDPAVIAEANSALGIRIDLDHVIETEYTAMDHRTFCVERLGVGDWPDLESPQGSIDFEQFAALFDAQSSATGPVCFAWDVNPERTSAAIAAAGWRDDGQVHLEVIDRRPGTEWVADRMADLTQKHPSLPSRCDQRGPAASLLGEVRNAGVTVEPMNSSELVQGCGLFFDGVEQATFRHRGAEEHARALGDAVRGAKKRPLGDAWAWSRKSSTVDISPLVACTLALWGTVQAGRPGGGFEW